jgi:amino acid transporter
MDAIASDVETGSTNGASKPKALSLLATHRPRNVGWLQAASLLFGDWGTSRLYVLGLAFAASGVASFWLICGMSLLVLAVAWAYTEICRLYPDGGGVYAAARQRSQVLAVVGALLLFADYTITVSLSALEGFHYFGLPDVHTLLHPLSPGLWAIVGIVVIGLFNLLGPKHTAGFALVAAIGMIAVTLVVAIGSFFHLSPHDIGLGFKPLDQSPKETWLHFVAIVLALSGVEAIANLTGVLKKPVTQTASKAIWVVAIEVAIFNVLLALVMVATAHEVPDLKSHENDMLAFLAGHHVGLWAEWMVRILGGILLLSAANTAIGGIIAVLYLLSRDGEAPQALQSLNRFGVPWLAAIIAFAVPSAVLISTHEVTHLAALYAIGVVGAVAINVMLCAMHPRLRRWYRKGPMVLLGVLLMSIWITLAFTKLHALYFVSGVMAVGLIFRALTKKFADDSQKPSLLRQAIVEQLTDEAVAKPKVLIGTYGSTSLADQALSYCQQHDAALVVCFIRELSLNHRFDSVQGRLTIDTDPVALKTFSEFLTKGHDKGVPIVPAYDTDADAATAMAETAALYGCDRILIGSSRKGTLHRLVKGTFQTRIESLLPSEIVVDVLQPQTT